MEPSLLFRGGAQADRELARGGAARGV